MANTYYDSQLTETQIENVLEAINGLIIPSNNGKVLAINSDTGKLEARSVQWGPSSAVIQPLSITENGVYSAPSGVDGYSPVTVNVAGGSDWQSLKEYITQSTNQTPCYFDTGYIVQNNAKIEAIVKVASSEVGQGLVPTPFGTRQAVSSGSDARACLLYCGGGSSSNKNILFYQFGNEQSSIYEAMTRYFDKKAAYRLTRGNVHVEDESEFVADALGFSSSYGATQNYSLYLFALNSAGAVNAPAYIKIYRVRIFEDDTLIHEYLPWLDGNNVVCLRDTVAQSLLYPASGTFLVGTDS